MEKIQHKNVMLTLTIGLLTLAAVSTVAINNLQIANAQGKSNDAYGKEIIRPNAQTGEWGSAVSSAAQDDSGQGIGDFRANGCKQTAPGVGGGCTTVPPS
jgi:hypothetical protein